MDVDTSLLRKLFRDITRGYSQYKYEGRDVYIKHLTTHDQVELEEVYDRYLEEAKARNIPTEESNLDLLIAEGDWTDEDEEYIHEKKKYLNSLISNKKHIGLKSQIDEQNRIIEATSKELADKQAEKENLMGRTCEKYARERVNDYYILESFYSNRELTDKMYTQKEYDEISRDELINIINIHNKCHNTLSEENIQKLILEDFFFAYMPFCEDSTQFYGQAVCNLTHHQIKLIVYSRVFKSIFEKHDKIPEHIKKDPGALLDFANSSDKNKDDLSKHEDKRGATTVFGAKEKDYEYMGVDKEEQRKGVSLYDAAKKKGGSLDMNDLIDLMGANPK